MRESLPMESSGGLKEAGRVDDEEGMAGLIALTGVR